MEKRRKSVTHLFSRSYKIQYSVPKSVFSPDYPFHPRTYGERLRKTRMDLGLQIREVAQATGINESSIIDWEKGHTRPRKDLLGRLEGFYESNCVV